MPGTTDSIIQPNKTGCDLNVRLHYIKFSSRSAHILHISPFPEERIRVISQSGEDPYSHLKRSSSVSYYHDMPCCGAKTKQFVALRNELIYMEASWEYSLLKETRRECGWCSESCQTQSFSLCGPQMSFMEKVIELNSALPIKLIYFSEEDSHKSLLRF